MELSNLIAAIDAGRVRITDHADEEASADCLRLDDIYRSVRTGEIIEDYPSDRPYPSALILGFHVPQEPVHSVWAYNEQNGWAVLVTVYRPDPERWIDSRHRRKRI